MARASDTAKLMRDEFEFASQEVMLRVLGPGCANLSILEREIGVTLGHRGLSVFVQGTAEQVVAALRLVDQLARAANRGRSFGEVDLVRGARILADHPETNLDEIFNEVIYVTARKRLVTPKGLAQKQYVERMRKNDLVFAIGPAGTGKTYLAVAVAVSELTAHHYRRIILARPAVEAGERLGFLPGDLAEKINPYLRPLYDSLDDMLGADKTQHLIAQDQIEIAPLAFMRGRTLNDSFVILDEAQNTTPEQMKMFLTRLGYSSKAVVTGDVSQIDLPGGANSGLVEARSILHGIPGIGFSEFSDVDVVRHPLVQQIIKAYDARSNGEMREGGGR
jgi:phosphate starvation-inducible protein PhoH and related proteins